MLERIQRATFELALEQGFDNTTVEQIAARADVAPRTIYAHYPTKESIVFSGNKGRLGVQLWLDGTDGDLVDRLDEFIRDRLAADPGIRVHFASELSQLRWRALLDDPYLRRLLRGHLDALEDLVAGKLQEELGFPAQDPGLRVIAAAISGLFLAMLEHAVADPDAFDPVRDCTRALTFIRAGMDALHAEAEAEAEV